MTPIEEIRAAHRRQAARDDQEARVMEVARDILLFAVLLLAASWLLVFIAVRGVAAIAREMGL